VKREQGKEQRREEIMKGKAGGGEREFEGSLVRQRVRSSWVENKARNVRGEKGGEVYNRLRRGVLEKRKSCARKKRQ